MPDGILNAFDVADRHCSFAKVLDQLKYPPQGKISIPGNPEGDNYKRQEGCTPNSLNTPAQILQSVNDLCYGGCATWSTANKYFGNKNPW